MRTTITIIILFLAVSAMNVFGQEMSFSYDQKNKALNIRLGVMITDQAQLQPLTLKLCEKTKQAQSQLPLPKLCDNTEQGSIIKEVEAKTIQPNAIKDLGGEKIGLVFNLNNNLTPGKKYSVEVSSAGIHWTSFDVNTGLSVTFVDTSERLCNGGIPMVFEGRESDLDLEPDADNNDLGDESEAFWTNILTYLQQPDLHKNMTVEIGRGKAEILQLESASLRKDATAADIFNAAVRFGKLTLCLDPVNAPAQGVSNIRVRFKNLTANQFSLGEDFIGEKFSWSGEPQIESSDALPDAPDDRKIERNLDLGLSFSSEVKKDAETNVKDRQNVGVLDLRLAPWVNIIKYKPGEKVIKRYTPAYLNANVSTGKITDSTLSLNRVILGTKFDLYFVPSLSLDRPKLKAERKREKCGDIADAAKKAKCEDKIDNGGNYIDFYSLSFKGEHLSDRDFKQKEVAAEIEFKPYWGLLNKPRSTRWFFIDDEITGEKTTAYKTFGWEIIPKIGFQFGKTYSRRNPAEAVVATDLLKRLYGGIEMNFDITSRFTLSLKDTLYGRYELDSDRLKNHFKGEIYTRLGNPWRNTTNGFFFSFEKGDAPPFTSTVNVFRFGYRIQSNGWNRFN